MNWVTDLRYCPEGWSYGGSQGSRLSFVGVAVELPIAASGEKATEAVLFPDTTSELSRATGPEKGAPESRDRLSLESWLPGVSLVPTGALKGPLLGGLLPLSRGPRANRSGGFPAVRQVGPELASPARKLVPFS